MALSRNEIENVASHYARQYDVWGQLTDLEEIVKHLGHDDFYLYRIFMPSKELAYSKQENKISR